MQIKQKLIIKFNIHDVLQTVLFQKYLLTARINEGEGEGPTPSNPHPYPPSTLKLCFLLHDTFKMI